MGSVVILCNCHVFLKTRLIPKGLVFHNLVDRGESLDGYNVMANNQNSFGENECDFYFQNHTVVLPQVMVKIMFVSQIKHAACLVQCIFFERENAA